MPLYVPCNMGTQSRFETHAHVLNTENVWAQVELDDGKNEKHHTKYYGMERVWDFEQVFLRVLSVCECWFVSMCASERCERHHHTHRAYQAR